MIKQASTWWSQVKLAHDGLGKQHFVPDAAQAPQPKPVEPENSLHMRKSHLDLLALAARPLEGLYWPISDLARCPS
jgi:hypothetical protein